MRGTMVSYSARRSHNNLRRLHCFSALSGKKINKYRYTRELHALSTLMDGVNNDSGGVHEPAWNVTPAVLAIKNKNNLKSKDTNE